MRKESMHRCARMHKEYWTVLELCVMHRYRYCLKSHVKNNESDVFAGTAPISCLTPYVHGSYLLDCLQTQHLSFPLTTIYFTILYMILDPSTAIVILAEIKVETLKLTRIKHCFVLVLLRSHNSAILTVIDCSSHCSQSDWSIGLMHKRTSSHFECPSGMMHKKKQMQLDQAGYSVGLLRTVENSSSFGEEFIKLFKQAPYHQPGVDPAGHRCVLGHNWT
ncbi:uncharacterized protein LOC143214282 [Lasioglossum baleicum]|uniref:uncharacterized protein LOC143214282 n=1 Tax=Lasioglossum baleicum TaxID=434251 RepID=UPI003FCEA938